MAEGGGSRPALPTLEFELEESLHTSVVKLPSVEAPPTAPMIFAVLTMAFLHLSFKFTTIMSIKRATIITLHIGFKNPNPTERAKPLINFFLNLINLLKF